MKKTTTKKTKLELKRKPVVELKPEKLKAVTGGGSTCRCIISCCGSGSPAGGGGH